ncbi:hypothetical protein F8S13_26080 [Chloroflexia bacterium SDU3-3]|nr:hypothetical protein F8S13_26080 [Chloroflexia bacterium SDU3-3]
MRPTSALRTALIACGICTTLGLGALDTSATARTSTDAPPDSQPKQYLIILDVSGSMSWNVDGEGTVSNIDYQCEWDAPRDLRYKDGCSGPNSFWRVENERRIYLAKQMVSNLIDVMRPEDRMEIIAFSSGRGYSGNTTIAPASGWESDHDALKASLLTVGSYNANPYITNGGSANTFGISKAQDALAVAPTTTPEGATYRTVVMLVADGPANIFANGTANTARDICPSLTASQAQNTATCQIGYSETYKMDRPITQLISAAAQLKQTYAVDLYTVTMTNKTEDMGMVDVASTPAMAYRYTSPDMLAQIAASYP